MVINVQTTTRCTLQGCTKRPSFGADDGSMTAAFCSQHTWAGMVDVRSKSCARKGCAKWPSFGVDDGR